MGTENRRAKVTPENKEEAKRLAALWATKAHPTQAEFGETYGIGNQSAVGQFLRGETPLSLKAARGFALGLGVNIEEFSPRLAREAAEIANLVPGDLLSPEVASLAAAVEQLPRGSKPREWVLTTLREAVKLAREMLNEKDLAAKSSPSADPEANLPKRRKSA